MPTPGLPLQPPQLLPSWFNARATGDISGPGIGPILPNAIAQAPPPLLLPDLSTPQQLLTVNELINQTDMPEAGFYIRPVGSPPGTLDRMKRIVEKQKACYRNALVKQR